MSRRQLYYLFERHGGVASFIRKRRLAACYNQLKEVTEKNAIGSIAYEYGFTNLSSFYRQFQAQYGLRPSEVRSAWLSGHKPGTTKAATFAEWLLGRDED
jgi:AraC-like DNA-binding protein